MQFRRGSSVVGFVVTAVLVAGAVHAQPNGSPSDPGQHADPATAAARTRFRQGAEAYANRRYMEAIQLFLDANRLSPNPAFAYNIGLSYEELGDVSSALKWYREYLRSQPEASDRPEIEGRIAQAERALSARGVQQVTILSTPDGATVTLDGDRVGVTPWSGELAPGTHRVALELRGYSDVTSSFDLPADHALDVPFEMKAGEGAVAAPSAKVAERVAPAASRISPLTWATLGAGALGLTTALVFAVSQDSALDDARDGTQVAGKQQYDRAGSYQNMALVSVGAGAALVAAGGVMLYLDIVSHPLAPGTRAALGCRGAFCGATVHGAF
jgi:tetratricopeptide (TPR) repeat protein